MYACMHVCMYVLYIYIYVYTLYRCILFSCMPHMHMSADTARMMATAILHYAVADDDRLERLLAQEQAPFPRPPKLQRLQRLLAQQQLLRLLAQQQTHSETLKTMQADAGSHRFSVFCFFVLFPDYFCFCVQTEWVLFVGWLRRQGKTLRRRAGKALRGEQCKQTLLLAHEEHNVLGQETQNQN